MCVCVCVCVLSNPSPQLERFTSMRVKKDKERGGPGPTQRHSTSYEPSGQSTALHGLSDESVLELFQQMLVRGEGPPRGPE